jgi:hypothetical protein
VAGALWQVAEAVSQDRRLGCVLVAKVLSNPSTLGPEPPSLYRAHENEASNHDGKRTEQ